MSREREVERARNESGPCDRAPGSCASFKGKPGTMHASKLSSTEFHVFLHHSFAARSYSKCKPQTFVDGSLCARPLLGGASLCPHGNAIR